MNEPKTDIEKLLRPDLWPNRPLMPMKKYDRSGPGPFVTAIPTFGIYHEDGRFIEGISIWEATENYQKLASIVPRLLTPARLIEEGWEID